MTKYLCPMTLCCLSFAGVCHAETLGHGRHQYVSTVNDSAKATADSRFTVEFKEKWVYFPATKKWKNQQGLSLTALELLEQGKITLRPVGSSKTVSESETLVSTTVSDNKTQSRGQTKPRQSSSPFVYVWDETKKNQIRIMCTGFGTYHKGIKR